jgi:hypothetical protein
MSAKPWFLRLAMSTDAVAAAAEHHEGGRERELTGGEMKGTLGGKTDAESLAWRLE